MQQYSSQGNAVGCICMQRQATPLMPIHDRQARSWQPALQKDPRHSVLLDPGDSCRHIYTHPHSETHRHCRHHLCDTSWAKLIIVHLDLADSLLADSWVELVGQPVNLELSIWVLLLDLL